MRVWLVTSFALALAWAPAGRAEEATALIWKGAKTRAEAEALLPAWKPIGQVLSSGGIAVPEGGPTLVESNTLPGLKPGFWVWVVGICPREDGGAVLEHLKSVAPDAYARDVKVPKEKLACPGLEAATLKVDSHRFKLDGGRVLQVFTYEESEAPEDDMPGDTFTRTHYRFALMSKAGQVLHSVAVVGEEDFSGDVRNGPAAYRCTVASIRRAKKDTVVFTRHCQAGIAECGSVVSGDEVTTLTLSGDSIESKEARRNEVREECVTD
ncbi:hypothetical protein [Pyxidicoccus xibeiensis]|uniref:hypothetical protein n=1 Tax=Pyxidicoccus xibeiensis TaxID=2906759 RepID=UPI0020A7C33A|nr:hypothetical protein [Pyxidicoccus xibeiensis]MCP3142692.1 hypothetical protein [Pyxidicoccus xibeiensis]